jgi:hypothetical protein
MLKLHGQLATLLSIGVDTVAIAFADVHLALFLVFKIFRYHPLKTHPANRGYELAPPPQTRQSALQPGIFSAQYVGWVSFDPAHSLVEALARVDS